MRSVRSDKSVRSIIQAVTGVDPDAKITKAQAKSFLAEAEKLTAQTNYYKALAGRYLGRERDRAVKAGKSIEEWIATRPLGLGRSSVYDHIAVNDALFGADAWLGADVLHLPWHKLVRQARHCRRNEGDGTATPKERTPAQQAASVRKAITAALHKVAQLPEAERHVLLVKVADLVRDLLAGPGPANDDDGDDGDEPPPTATPPVPGEAEPMEHHADMSMKTASIMAVVEAANNDGGEGHVTPAIVTNPNRKVRKPRWGVVPGLLPYSGGKSRSVDIITEEFGRLAPGTVFVEPCVGSGVVTLNMLAKGYVEWVRISDIDAGVVALWNAVIQQPEELKRRVLTWEATITDRNRFERELLDGTLTGLDLAFAKLVVTRISYRSLGAKANTPPKYITWSQWNPHYIVALIDRHHGLLKGRVVGGCCTQADLMDVIAEPGDRVLFIDPPYVLTGESSYQHHLEGTNTLQVSPPPATRVQ